MAIGGCPTTSHAARLCERCPTAARCESLPLPITAHLVRCHLASFQAVRAVFNLAVGGGPDIRGTARSALLQMVNTGLKRVGQQVLVSVRGGGGGTEGRRVRGGGGGGRPAVGIGRRPPARRWPEQGIVRGRLRRQGTRALPQGYAAGADAPRSSSPPRRPRPARRCHHPAAPAVTLPAALRRCRARAWLRSAGHCTRSRAGPACRARCPRSTACSACIARTTASTACTARSSASRRPPASRRPLRPHWRWSQRRRPVRERLAR